MADYSPMSETSNDSGWLEASGLRHILRTLGLSIQPSKLCIGLAAIAFTCALGFGLDAAWKGAQRGVAADALTQLIQSRERGQPYTEAAGPRGVFDVWARHQQRCVLGLLGSSIPATSLAGRTSLGAYVQTHSATSPLNNLANIVLGSWWMLRYHSLYFILFGAGILLIWSAAGGTVCRMAAVQFAKDEKLTLKQAWGFTRQKLFTGFFLAPCIPLIFVALVIAVMVAGGLVLGIPFVGDVVGGAAFALAILGGFVITILLAGLIVGGNLLWPAIAVEGSDAFDAFSRSLSYPLTRPWKAILYAVLAVVFAAVCWMAARLFTFFMLTITRIIVGFGTAPFGWWGRGDEGDLPGKLERIWPMGGPGSLYIAPNWSELPWYECISAALIGIHIVIVIGLLWSFLASFYFSGSTVIYCLLRRDVDAVELDDVFIEELDEDGPTGDSGAGTPPGTSAPIPAPPLTSSDEDRPEDEDSPDTKKSD